MIFNKFFKIIIKLGFYAVQIISLDKVNIQTQNYGAARVN